MIKSYLGPTKHKLDHKFSVDSLGTKVLFAKGNLQYRASDNKWRFAENQWDTLRDGGGNTTPLPDRSTQNLWIDLFNYGATGYNNGQNEYNPWCISDNANDYYMHDTQGTTADFAYAYNVQYNTNYKLLRSTQLEYLINGRSGSRYAKATVNNVEGLILIPDDGTLSLSGINNPSAMYSANIISAANWIGIYELAGYVFLPAGGYRKDTTVGLITDNICGFYHASDQNSNDITRDWFLQVRGESYGVSVGSSTKGDAKSVRLVKICN